MSPSSRDIDLLIVGGGLAGITLAMQAIERGKEVVVVSGNYEGSASKVAAGLTNPVTGKRLVLSWLIDSLIPAARQYYQGLEKKFNQRFFYPMTIKRFIPNEDILNQWQANLRIARDRGYVAEGIYTYQSDNVDLDYLKILNGFHLDVQQLMVVLTSYLISKDLTVTDRFAHSSMQFRGNKILYKNIRAKNIVFCEGAWIKENPYFSELDFRVNKGDVLHTYIPNLELDSVLSWNVFLLPKQQENRFLLGSTYIWDAKDIEPSANAVSQLSELAHRFVKNEIVIENQQAGWRPATYDRRPFIGSHSDYKNMFVFNGFGSKGTSMIPFFSQQLLSHIYEEGQLNQEVNVYR